MKSWTVRVLVLAMLLVCVAAAHAQSVPAPAGHTTEAKSEANLVLPDLGSD